MLWSDTSLTGAEKPRFSDSTGRCGTLSKRKLCCVLRQFDERRVEQALARKVQRHVLAFGADEAELQRNVQRMLLRLARVWASPAA